MESFQSWSLERGACVHTFCKVLLKGPFCWVKSYFFVNEGTLYNKQRFSFFIVESSKGKSGGDVSLSIEETK